YDGKITSIRISSCDCGTPRSPTCGFACSEGVKVPVPSSWKEQSLYSPSCPAPAAKTAVKTESLFSSGTKKVNLFKICFVGRRILVLVRFSRSHIRLLTPTDT